MISIQNIKQFPSNILYSNYHLVIKVEIRENTCYTLIQGERRIIFIHQKNELLNYKSKQFNILCHSYFDDQMNDIYCIQINNKNVTFSLNGDELLYTTHPKGRYIREYNFVQFVDCNVNTFRHPYSNSIKRCQQIIIKLQLLLERTHKEEIPLPQVPNVQFVFENHRQYLKKFNMSSASLLDKIQQEVFQKYQSMCKSINSLKDFGQKINQLEDYKYLLFKAREVFHSKQNSSETDFQRHTLEQLKLVNISGIIESKDLIKFTKMIFRITKGNSILYTFSIPKQSQQNHQHRSRTAFICILESGSLVLSKIGKICDNFNVAKYKLPSNKDQIFSKIKQIEDNITDTKQLYVMTQKTYLEDLNNVIKNADFQVSLYDAYKIILQRQLMIYQTLNMMQQTQSIMIGCIWIPTQKIGLLNQLVPSFVSLRPSQPITKPPTHFQMNQFTTPFQQVVNTYGVPRYQQVNPAIYAIQIFPFLFGIMFGDIGHGGILLSFSIWLIVSAGAKKLLPDLYAIRFLFLLMGIFSFYCGWIYNQFFSIPFNVFGSCYKQQNSLGYAIKQNNCVYPFGFDPKWFKATNDLNFFNSYKMKFAVIIGVAQMTFAIVLKMLNTLHFKNYVDFIFQWLPQQVFFFCTFGYMSFLIIFKWTIPWGVQRNISQAPSLINQMISFPLRMGSTDGKPLWDIESQQDLQFKFLIISLICVPLMLIPKPLIIWIQSIIKAENQGRKKNNNKYNEQLMDTDLQLNKRLNQNFKQGQQEVNQEEAHQSVKSVLIGKDHNQQISQIAVHQIIQTIQFILGSISNTASYLRLWALSLAHGQLSKVFFQKTVGSGITSSNPIIILIGSCVFFNVTIGVILGMDSMQCFLHALRLQWVEFQGKFYQADGWKFQPLSLTTIQAKVNASRNFD